MRHPETNVCDLLVIGMGMAGMAAALFAVNRSLSVIQIGITGEIIFSSGLLDLLGVHPVQSGKIWKDPWAGIETLRQDIPGHPYARLSREEIEASLDEALCFLEEAGLPYTREKGHNVEMMMPLGIPKQTYAVPRSMWKGVQALTRQSPCLIIDFHGLNDFSAMQMAHVLAERWPGLRAASTPFPGNLHNRALVTGEMMATEMESRSNREGLARSVRPLVQDALSVGFPAVLGMNRTAEIIAELEQGIGVPVFEIPTLPVSVPGLRLNDAFARGLSGKGVRRFTQSRVLRIQKEQERDFLLSIGTSRSEHRLQARGVILASGRFWGRGLSADRNGIREPLLDLPVRQPPGREQWHQKDFLDHRGHLINRAGLEIDDLFRPLDRTGAPAFERLFAAGSILAHQDWMRMKCGSGLAISTAYGAVKGFLQVKD